MLDRYTQRARRSLFFARDEVSQLGGQCVTVEHLLLGVAREATGVIGTALPCDPNMVESLRTSIHERNITGERVPTSVEIPFSDEVCRVLVAAAAEADALGHANIDTEHLLLGIFRESDRAATLIGGDEISLDSLRAAVAQSLRSEGR